MVDEDVASITMLYTYRISGHLYNPYSGEYVCLLYTSDAADE